MSEVRKSIVLATAAWTELHGLTQTYQAAVLRGDTDEAERLRQRGHDLLDSVLDLNSEAATAAKALLGG